MKFLYVLFFPFILLSADILPKYDTRCDALKVNRCPTKFLLQRMTDTRATVPRIIHQIDLYAKNSISSEKWRTYANQHNFSYRIWSCDHLSAVVDNMSPENRELLTTFLELKDEENAVNLLRFEILKQYGGFYCASTLTPPKYDLLQTIEPSGLTLITATGHHNTGSYLGFMPSTDFIASPPNHPLMEYACLHIESNASHWQKTVGNSSPFYATGPAFLNRILNGTYHVLPATYLKSLSIYETVPPITQESLLVQPDFDTNCYFLKTKAYTPIKSDFINQKEKIPRHIHQIWFGDQTKLSQESIAQWKNYCEKHGFVYHLWNEANIREFLDKMPKARRSLFQITLCFQNWWAASDILRLEVLKEYGGIYLDCDFHPPKIDGETVDFFSLFDDTGITLMIEPFSRSIGTPNALFVANGFCMAPPYHPFLIHTSEQIGPNTDYFFRRTQTHNAMYVTGPFLINRVLNNPINVVSIHYLNELDVYLENKLHLLY